jgi:hypothetical protein
MTNPNDDESKNPPGISSRFLRGMAAKTLTVEMSPGEAGAVDMLVDDVERLAQIAGSTVAAMTFFAIRELAAGLVAWNGVRSQDELMAALAVEIDRRAVELRAVGGAAGEVAARADVGLASMPCSSKKH